MSASADGDKRFSWPRRLIAGAAAAAFLFAGTAMAHAHDPDGPLVGSVDVRTRPSGSLTVEVAVSARPRDAEQTVTEVQIEWGDRSGIFANNFCRAFSDGEPGPHKGETITFRRIRHRYKRPGRYRLRVSAKSETCPAQTNDKVGPPVGKWVRVGGRPDSGSDRETESRKLRIWRRSVRIERSRLRRVLALRAELRREDAAQGARYAWSTRLFRALRMRIGKLERLVAREESRG